MTFDMRKKFFFFFDPCVLCALPSKCVEVLVGVSRQASRQGLCSEGFRHPAGSVLFPLEPSRGAEIIPFALRVVTDIL